MRLGVNAHDLQVWCFGQGSKPAVLVASHCHLTQSLLPAGTGLRSPSCSRPCPSRLQPR